MRYWVERPWPVGSWLVPRTTVIDWAADDQWSVLCRGLVPPPESIALDDEALAFMRGRYASPWHGYNAVFMGQA